MLEILELQQKIVEELAKIDIIVVDAQPFVRGDVSNRTLDEIRRDTIAGKISMFFRVEAVFGDAVWAFLGEEET